MLSADDLSSFKDDSDALESKMKEIRNKCKGDLAMDKAEDDCEAAKNYEKTAEKYNKALGDTYVALKEAMSSKVKNIEYESPSIDGLFLCLIF